MSSEPRHNARNDDLGPVDPAAPQPELEPQNAGATAEYPVSRSQEILPTEPEADGSVADGAGADGAAAEPRQVRPDPELVQEPGRSRAASTWAALIIGALLLVLLLVFVAQNTHNVDLHVMGYQFSFPLGIGMLLAAIAGALIMACVGGWRMYELSRQLKKTRRALQQVNSGF